MIKVAAFHNEEGWAILYDDRTMMAFGPIVTEIESASLLGPSVPEAADYFRLPHWPEDRWMYYSVFSSKRLEAFIVWLAAGNDVTSDFPASWTSVDEFKNHPNVRNADQRFWLENWRVFLTYEKEHAFELYSEIIP